MRLNFRYIFIFCFLLQFLANCTKKEGLEPENTKPIETPKSSRVISFSASSAVDDGSKAFASFDALTKTVYRDGIVNGKKQIYWVVNDSVLIFSPQVSAPASKQGVYQISSLLTDNRNAILEAKRDALEWGIGVGEHSFYAAYPATNNISKVDTNIVRATLPNEQSALVSGNIVTPNMQYAYMVGGNRVKEDSRPVSIPFQMNVTTFKINFKNESSKKIKMVRLTSASKAMCGIYDSKLSVKSSYSTNGVPWGGLQIAYTFPTFNNSGSSANNYVGAYCQQVDTGEQASVVFFALPQQYNDLSISFYEDTAGQSVILDKPLKSGGVPITFAAAKYHEINIGNVVEPIIYHIDVDPPTISFNYLGGSDQYAVESYKHDLATDVKTPLEWKTQINTGTVESPVWVDLTNSNMPVWISGVEKNVVPTTSSPISYSAVVPDQDVSFTPNSHTLALKARAEVGSSSSPVDLSRVSLPTGTNGTRTAIQQTTANCYVVGAKGWYKFPMVYGNAIHNGNTNTSAYISAVTSDLALSNFVDHKGSPISQPWVSTAYSISKVALIWEDQPKLITELSMSGTTEKYITFRVTENAIHQGNALIAAYDSENKVAWSWHIWVTNEDLTTINMKNASGTTFKTLPVNIGTVRHTEQYTYEGRVAYFRVVQYESGVATGQVKEFTISQIETVCPEEWNTNTLYQFGRKDPMLGSDGRTHYPKRIWHSDNTFERTLNPNYLGYSNSNPPTTAVQAIDMLSKLIQNPFTYCMSRYLDNMYYNLWNMNQIVTSDNNPPTVVKTVYDPSPAGLSLPHASAYNSFRNNYQLRTNPYDYSYGINFYMEPNKRGQLLFFPTFGARNYNSNMFSYPTGDAYGYWWTSGIYGATHASGYSLAISINGGASFQGSDRAYGMSVRPVEESNGINPYTSTEPWNDADPPIGLDW